MTSPAPSPGEGEEPPSDGNSVTFRFDAGGWPTGGRVFKLAKGRFEQVSGPRAVAS